MWIVRNLIAWSPTYLLLIGCKHYQRARCTDAEPMSEWNAEDLFNGGLEYNASYGEAA